MCLYSVSMLFFAIFNAHFDNQRYNMIFLFSFFFFYFKHGATTFPTDVFWISKWISRSYENGIWRRWGRMPCIHQDRRELKTGRMSWKLENNQTMVQFGHWIPSFPRCWFFFAPISNELIFIILCILLNLGISVIWWRFDAHRNRSYSIHDILIQLERLEWNLINETGES